MEFEEMQKIWDAQHHQPLYAINEQALHNRIAAKKHSAHRVLQFTEWLLLIANTFAGIGLLAYNYAKKGYLFVYILALWFLVSGLYVLINRVRRLRQTPRFDRSLLGDLQHGLASASYQVRIALIMRWNLLPVAALTLVSIWETVTMRWLVLPAAFFLVIVYYASGWELGIYRRRFKELKGLEEKLLS